MEDISKSFTADHRHCDGSFVAIEQAVSRSDWETAESRLDEFITQMEHHFRVEEDELFPALEQASVAAAGPIQVMRMEHEQMRYLFKDLQNSVRQQSVPECLGITETLLVTMQQHNMKEENILYPMADRSIAAEGGRLKQSLHRR